MSSDPNLCTFCTLPPAHPGPHEWSSDPIGHTEHIETGIALAVREIDEMRAALNAIRDYARSLRDLVAVTRDAGGTYLAHTYEQIATTVERKIGDKP